MEATQKNNSTTQTEEEEETNLEGEKLIYSKMNIVGIRTTPRIVLRTLARQQSTSSTTANAAVKQSGIKKLMSKYGYSALIVYIGVTFISLPTCYFTVHSLGEERIAILLNRGKKIFGYGEETDDLVKLKVQEKQLKRLKAREKYVGEEIENENVRNPSFKDKLQLKWDSIKTSPILTELILAYGLHKSLIFVRIPLTAAITPSFARILPKRFVGGVNRIKASKSFHSMNNMNHNATSNSKGSLPDGVYPKQQKTGFQKWFNGLF